MTTTTTFELSTHPPRNAQNYWLPPPTSNRGIRKDLVRHVPFPLVAPFPNRPLVIFHPPMADMTSRRVRLSLKQQLPVRVVCTEWRNACVWRLAVWESNYPMEWLCLAGVACGWGHIPWHGNADGHVRVDGSFGIESRRLRLDLSVGYYDASAVKRCRSLQWQTQTDSND